MPESISTREAAPDDRAFILSLTQTLAEVARFDWHGPEILERFQSIYIEEMLDDDHPDKVTYIAEVNGKPMGYIHVRSGTDEISGETRGTIPLLAVTDDAQGLGVGKRLIGEAENWIRRNGWRLMHLEVFATNDKARAFYRAMAFQEESINLIKDLS